MPYLGVSYLEPSFTAVTQKFVKHRRHKKNVSQKKVKKDTRKKTTIIEKWYYNTLKSESYLIDRTNHCITVEDLLYFGRRTCGWNLRITEICFSLKCL